jgi:hypothetical protein
MKLGDNQIINGAPGMATTIVLRDNSWRLPHFQTRTVIETDGNARCVCKYALTETAIPFLKVIIERERASVDYLKNNFDVLCGVLKEDHIEYPYCPHRSLQAVIQDFLDQRDFRSANSTIQEYVVRLHSLKKMRTFPEDFLALVGDIDKNKFIADVFTHGIIDLTPPNILLDGNKWIVLDNEWFFDFPVPIVYVFFRAFTALAFELQRQVRLNANEDNPITSLLSRRFRCMYFPQAWVSHFSDSCVSLERLIFWEKGFQKYVTDGCGGFIYKVRKNRKTYTNFPFLWFWRCF